MRVPAILPLQERQHDRSTNPTINQDINCATSQFSQLSTFSTAEVIRDRIERISADVDDLQKFYNIKHSPRRTARLRSYLQNELDELKALASTNSTPFNSYSPDEKVDYLLLKKWLVKNLRDLASAEKELKEMAHLLAWSEVIVKLSEDRQEANDVDSQDAAAKLEQMADEVVSLENKIKDRKLKIDKFPAYRASLVIAELEGHLREWFSFFNGYDPMFTWCKTPPQSLSYLIATN
jgi:hypothetical protein